MFKRIINTGGLSMAAMLVLMSYPSTILAQEQKLNGMDFINPYRGDSAFISNSFEVSQKFSSTGFAEALEMELKFDDYFGLFGKFNAGFGMDAHLGEMQVTVEGAVFSEEGVAIRVFRVEQLASQLGFRLKLQQIQSKFVGVDSERMDIDETYYKSLEGKDEDEINTEEVIEHIKDDLKKGLEDAEFSGKSSSSSVGISFNLATAYTENLASQISLETLFGNKNTIVDSLVIPERIVDTSFNFSLLLSLKPLVPAVVQGEYQYDIGRVGPVTHSVVGSLYYNNKEATFSVGIGAGQTFSERNSTIGNLSGRYYF